MIEKLNQDLGTLTAPIRPPPIAKQITVAIISPIGTHADMTFPGGAILTIKVFCSEVERLMYKRCKPGVTDPTDF
jgi:hypothetical protein